ARLARAKQLGLIPVPTPGGTLNLRESGPSTGLRASVRRLPYRSLIAMGFRPPGNSDTAGTRTDMINPFLNIYGLVTRTNASGVAVQPEEALSVTDALRVYSLFGAYAGFDEHLKGSLEPGKLADLIVVRMDQARQTPMYEPVSHLVYTTRGDDVDTTIVNGRVLMRSGRVLTLNEAQVLDAARVAAGAVRAAVQ
ncbi:MAG: amidohydrolase family protein, partial [Vicinamibacterales bacterium]